jgi:uncharacterized repeat protein (TIGR01451 family)
MKKIFFGSILSLLFATTAIAEDISVTVDVLTEIEVTDLNGDKLLERKALDVATPEQTVIYRITVANTGTENVNDVTLNIPISDSITIKPGTFQSDIEMTTQFSLDGKIFAPFAEISGAKEQDISAVRIDIYEVPREEIFFIEYDAIVR